MEKGKQPLLYALSSGASALLDTGLFHVLNLLFGSALGSYAVPVFYVAARLVSSFFNFNMNYRLVFRSGQTYGKAMLRYYCLAVPQAGAGTVLVTLFVRLLNVQSVNGQTGVKIVVECFLFVASFLIQKFWVFRKKDPMPEKEERAEE